MQDLETDGRATILEQDPEAGYFKARLQFSLASAVLRDLYTEHTITGLALFIVFMNQAHPLFIMVNVCVLCTPASLFEAHVCYDYLTNG